jgi:hypothetical protein
MQSRRALILGLGTSDPGLARVEVKMMTISRRSLVAVLSAAALCATLAGCVSDMGASTADGQGTHQLRYYGGPKYPSWPEQ